MDGNARQERLRCIRDSSGNRSGGRIRLRKRWCHQQTEHEEEGIRVTPLPTFCFHNSTPISVFVNFTDL
jgi:hypothetical protein